MRSCSFPCTLPKILLSQYRRKQFLLVTNEDFQTMDGFSEGKFLSNSGVKAGDIKETSRVQPPKLKDANTQDTVLEKPSAVNEASNRVGSRAPATKAQVMGWPPIRSFRTNTITSALKNNEEVDGKAGSPALFIKVSMNGAPYLRKVNLRNYSAYQELSSADFGEMAICPFFFLLW